MPTARHFLGWDKPCLAVAADWLLEHAARRDGQTVDLRDVAVVLPGGRAGRRLMELLIDGAAAIDCRLVPPRILTTGSMLDELLVHPKPLADDIARRLAWIDAVQALPDDALAAVIPRPPDRDDRLAWAGIADQLEAMHVELAGENLSFADVAERCQTILDFSFRDTERWTALAAVQEAYGGLLASAGLADPQAARWAAIRAGAFVPVRRVVLIAAADLNALQRALVEGMGDRAAALVHAPADRAADFDALGCIRPETWSAAAIAVRDEQVHVVGGPAEQAAEVIRQLHALGGAFAASQITVGVCDEQVTPYLRQALPEFDMPVRDAGGTEARRTPLIQMLAASADWLESGRLSALAALLRHPDVESAVRRRLAGDRGAGPAIERWLDLMDRYACDHLQGTVAAWLGDPEVIAPLKRVYDAVAWLMGDLRGAARPLDRWAEPIVQMIVRVHGGAELRRSEHRDRLVIEAAGLVRERAMSLMNLPGALSPRVGAAEAVRLILHDLEGEAVAPDPREAAIELLGPLELQLDDAPVLIVMGFNDGRLPSSVNADAFLPDAIRIRLGVMNNQRRLARDAYMLTAVLASRPHVHLVAGRVSDSGDPLPPSRLWLACGEARLVERIERFFPADRDEAAPSARLTRRRPGETAQLPVPLLPARPVGQSMRVTEFRDYLACPYRYYLRHVLRLDAMDDRAEELDGGAFGELAHGVLAALGRSDLAASTDAGKIAALLLDELGRRVRQMLGEAPPAAVRVQVEQLRRRLEAFAQWQAAWAAEGWRIAHVETGCDKENAAPFTVDDAPVLLRGRIDRIDVHPTRGVVIFDYKTGDTVDAPAKTHHRGERWIDLQLPLYRRLARHLKIIGDADDDRVQLGYILLPKDVSRTGASLAGWTAEQLAEADEAARRVVREIRAGHFEMCRQPVDGFDEFDAICQVGRLAELAAEAGSEEDEP